MKVHTPQAIEQIQAISRQAGETVYTLGAISVRYAVIAIPEAQKPFPMAVAAAFPWIGQPKPSGQTGGILVSDDVPNQLQGLWALHELIDFTIVGHDAIGRCATSEQSILNGLEASGQAALAREYVTERVNFFMNLEQYMSADLDRSGEQSQYEKIDIDGCTLAASVLSRRRTDDLT